MDKTFNKTTPYEIYLELKRRALRESTPEINYYTICGSLGEWRRDVFVKLCR